MDPLQTILKNPQEIARTTVGISPISKSRQVRKIISDKTNPRNLGIGLYIGRRLLFITKSLLYSKRIANPVIYGKSYRTTIRPVGENRVQVKYFR